jgi:hypothetical protein
MGLARFEKVDRARCWTSGSDREAAGVASVHAARRESELATQRQRWTAWVVLLQSAKREISQRWVLRGRTRAHRELTAFAEEWDSFTEGSGGGRARGSLCGVAAGAVESRPAQERPEPDPG